MFSPIQMATIDEWAMQEFIRAQHKAFWRTLKSWFTRQCNQLLPLERESLLCCMQNQRHFGLKTIPLDHIVGSEGRYREFDRAFFPRQRYTMERWLSLARAHYNRVSLPPVDLIKVGDRYFVTDGNHRISVARALGQTFIDAQVVEVNTTVSLPDIC